tara:strand:+ start:48 stop:785 length:738 start_codon:yes stop_codon:yes gene_type:complete
MPIDPETKKTLDNRLASGEIGIEEYEQILKAITAGERNTPASPLLTPIETPEESAPQAGDHPEAPRRDEEVSIDNQEGSTLPNAGAHPPPPSKKEVTEIIWHEWDDSSTPPPPPKKEVTEIESRFFKLPEKWSPFMLLMVGFIILMLVGGVILIYMEEGKAIPAAPETAIPLTSEQEDNAAQDIYIDMRYDFRQYTEAIKEGDSLDIRKYQSRITVDLHKNLNKYPDANRETIMKKVYALWHADN